MNKRFLISIVVIMAIVAGVIAAKYLVKKEGAPTSPENQTVSLKEDSTASINQTLEETETLDLDKEFQSLDAELKNL